MNLDFAVRQRSRTKSRSAGERQERGGGGRADVSEACRQVASGEGGRVYRAGLNGTAGHFFKGRECPMRLVEGPLNKLVKVVADVGLKPGMIAVDLCCGD